MSGQELYNMYVEAMAAEGCVLDEWEQLGDIDRNAWDKVALQLAA